MTSPSARGARAGRPLISPERAAELAAEALATAQRFNGKWVTCAGDQQRLHYYVGGRRPCDNALPGSFPYCPTATPKTLRCPACQAALEASRKNARRKKTQEG